MLDDFISLSTVLTGEQSLDRGLAEKYMQRVSNGPFGDKLNDLLKVFREIVAAGGDLVEEVRQRIMNDPTLGLLAGQVIIIWYTSALPSENGQKWDFPDDPDQYFSGLVWSVIHAHPPGLSGGYFGHWKYPPEN